MKAKPPTIIPGDPSIRKDWILLISLYILLLLCIDPVLHWLLGLQPPEPTTEAIAKFNAKSLYMSGITYAIARCLPLFLFLWLAKQILLTQKLPPPGIKLPFAAPLLEGKQARMAGMLLMALSLLLLLREASHIIRLTS